MTPWRPNKVIGADAGGPRQLPIRSHRAARIARKKILVVGVAAAVLIVGFWFYWSPRASVSGNLSLRDLVAIRWAVRTQTLQPILIIYQGATGTVKVLTGVQRAPLDGSGYFYELKKTTNGWKITESGGWVS